MIFENRGSIWKRMNKNDKNMIVNFIYHKKCKN